MKFDPALLSFNEAVRSAAGGDAGRDRPSRMGRDLNSGSVPSLHASMPVQRPPTAKSRPVRERAQAALLGCLLCLSGGMTGSTQAATAGLDTFSVNYVVSRNGFDIGESTGTLTREEDGRFRFRRDVNTTGMLVWLFRDKIFEESVWTLHAQGIRPLTYTYSQTGGKRERHVQLKFDWTKGRVENIIGKDAWRMDIPAGTLDKLVVQFAMMLDLQHGKREMSYAIADGGKLKEYRFRQVGVEVLKTPAGSYRTLKMERVRDKGKRATYLWCAPKLNYLPVRVDQREDDDENFRMLLKHYEGF